MGADYKLLDPNRKAVLELPNAAFKLWHAYWMFESDDQEAYPSLATLVAVTKMSENTILTARRYLLKTGWLIKLEGSAAERFSSPTRGAHHVAIYRVDDPTSKIEAPKNCGTSNVIPPKFEDKFLVSVSSCFSDSSISVPVTQTSGSQPVHTEESSLRSDEKPKPKNEKTKNQRPSRAEAKAESDAKWLENYGEPRPAGFNTWTQAERTRWCVERDSPAKRKEKALSRLVDKMTPAPEETETPAESRLEPTPTRATPSRDENDAPIIVKSYKDTWCYTCDAPKSDCLCLDF